jgi:hypothetical protein
MNVSDKSFLTLDAINVADSPLDRLHLLEEVQNGRDFLVSIYAENKQDAPKLQELQQQLDNKKYGSTIEIDSFGRDVLRLHYVGKNTDIISGFEKLGAIGGIIQAAQQIAKPVVEGANQLVAFAKYNIEEPARAFSLLYFMGDAGYIFAGKLDTLEGKLMKASGLMAVAQSVLYMVYARDKTEYEIEDFQHRISSAIKADKNPFDELWNDPPKKQGFNPIKPLTDFLVDNPIDSGANVQIVGQLFLAASGIVSMSKGQQGLLDIARAATSITAWSILKMDEKQIEHKTPWNENPLARIGEEVSSAPQRYSSIINTFASLVGLGSSALKIISFDGKMKEIDASIKSSTENNIAQLKQQKQELIDNTPHGFTQFVSELPYFFGDVTMSYLDKSETGQQAANNTQNAGTLIADFISKSELLMSETPQQQLIDNRAKYIAKKIVAQEIRQGRMFADAAELETEHIANELKRNIVTELSSKPNRYQQAVNIIARISDLYPKEQKAKIENALIEKLSSFKEVNIKPEEMLAALQETHTQFGNIERTKQPAMSEISPLIKDLSGLLPSVKAGIYADGLYQTLLNCSKPQAQIFSADTKFQKMQPINNQVLIMQH